MRETPDAGRKRIDLNVPQVAGGALAAVVAAKLASYFGVYGTILGAGVVSVVATCGGTVFQHFFKRTGEQLKERSTVPARPRGRQAPPPGRFGESDEFDESGGPGEFGRFDESGRSGEFGEGTVYRARVRSRRRPVVAAAVVFGVTMAGITGYELASGSSFDGGQGTTMSDAVTGRHSSPSKSGTGGPGSPAPGSSRSGGGSPSPAPSRTPGGQRSGSGEGASGGATPTPGDSAGTGPSDGPSPSATPTPGTSAATPTPPEPSASSRSGTADPDRDGPAAP
ncbi:hypothetical protein ACGFT2_26460 [Streptomyces sp. NPDC048514]|uniref:hypothetical protein n=1 Tax=Streptomyces sp. NPDC048514 TaxID=3365564 RepID=UPI00371C27E0